MAGGMGRSVKIAHESPPLSDRRKKFSNFVLDFLQGSSLLLSPRKQQFQHGRIDHFGSCPAIQAVLVPALPHFSSFFKGISDQMLPHIQVMKLLISKVA